METTEKFIYEARKDGTVKQWKCIVETERNYLIELELTNSEVLISKKDPNHFLTEVEAQEKVNKLLNYQERLAELEKEFNL